MKTLKTTAYELTTAMELMPYINAAIGACLLLTIVAEAHIYHPGGKSSGSPN